MIATTLINIWAGSGCGKSTTAAEMFALMKHQGHSVELVREYVKDWAWRGDKIGPFDDVYITAKQMRRESCLYGKVEYVITDSPLGLGAVYEELYKPNQNMMWDLTRELRRRQALAGIAIVDVLLQRTKPYVQAGRWETEAAARNVDAICQRHLAMLCPEKGYHTASCADVIIELLGLTPF